MMILSASDLGKSYGTDVILEGVSFHINKGDRVGIVGANGAGKTTLMNILTGEILPDEGSFFTAKDVTVGYLKQKDDFDPENTVIEEVRKIFRPFYQMEEDIHNLNHQIADMAKEGKTEGDKDFDSAMRRLASLQEEYRNKGGFSYRSEVQGILGSMAFGEDTYDKKTGTLSGGEKTRLSLACLLMKKPDLFFLDEPTNHLDIGTLKWLEQYIKSYSGTVVIISHDRYFLDQTANRIFQVENHKLKCYDGNYSQFAEKKKANRDAEIRAYEKQQREIKRQEDMIRRYKERGTEKLAKRAASREKMLDRMDVLDRPENLPGQINFKFHQNYRSGNDVLHGENIGKTFVDEGGKRELFHDIDFDIKRGERVCIVGHNGCGKTTLLKILTEQVKPSEGFLKIGHNVDFGYYDQEQSYLNDNNTVIDEVHNAYRLYKDSEIRGILGRFMFKGEQVFLKVGDLSGGEKARLSLVKLMMSGANVLILDEPTNHLDIESKEVIEEAIREYPGTVIAVSHDRYFLNKIPDRILEMSSEGFKEYAGKYDYYIEKKESVDSARSYMKNLPGAEQTREEDTVVEQGLSSAEERELKKKIQAEERRLKREKAALEKQIEKLEEKIQKNEEKMCNPEILADHEKLRVLADEGEKLNEELEKAYGKWLEL